MFPISFCMTILEGLILIYIDLCISSQFLKNQFVQVLMLWWSQYLDQIFHARLVFWWTIFHFSAFDTVIKEWASLELDQKIEYTKTTHPEIHLEDIGLEHKAHDRLKSHMTWFH